MKKSITPEPEKVPFVARVKRLFGVKSEEEIVRDVQSEPHVQRALKAIARNRAVLDELEALEKRNR